MSERDEIVYRVILRGAGPSSDDRCFVNVDDAARFARIMTQLGYPADVTGEIRQVFMDLENALRWVAREGLADWDAVAAMRDRIEAIDAAAEAFLAGG
jgi:hypothetical protein